MLVWRRFAGMAKTTTQRWGLRSLQFAISLKILLRLLKSKANGLNSAS